MTSCLRSQSGDCIAISEALDKDCISKVSELRKMVPKITFMYIAYRGCETATFWNMVPLGFLDEAWWIVSVYHGTGKCL